MAAAVSSVWAKPGAWALEAEEQDAELQQQSLPSNQTVPSSDFPSLATAATTKTKKKKPQTLSLAEFTTYGAPKAATAPQTERLTQAELVSLPTGPRERSAEELDRSKLGGGFRSYGRDRDESRWGSSRASEDGERRGGGFNRERDSGRDSGPSRADETDDWAAGKKSIGGNGFERGPGNGFERRERGPGGGFFDSQSKADEVDSWVSSKPRFVSSGSNGGGGDRFEKRGSFESLSRNRDSQFGGGADSDTWGRRREESGAIPAPGGGGGSRPRLVLQPRTLPAPVVDVKPESPVTVRQESPVIVERPKGANPFGNARPREEVLAEKGQDWKEIDEKLEAVKLKDVAAAIEKTDERSPGKMGFGFGKDDRTEKSWRKSSEQSEGVQQEESAVEESNKEEPAKEEAGEKEAENGN